MDNRRKLAFAEVNRMRRVWMGVLMGALIFVGCRAATTQKQLSETQIQILRSAGSGEGRLRAGNLTSVDKKLLEEYEYALAYLEGKYGEAFAIDTCSPSGSRQSYTIFYGEAPSHPGQRVEVDVVAESGERTARDDYYGILMRDAYNSCVEEILEGVNLPSISVDVHLPNLYGESYDKDCTPRQAMDSGMELRGRGEIVLNGEGLSDSLCEAALIDVQEALKTGGISGSFRISFSGSDTEYQDMIHLP